MAVLLNVVYQKKLGLPQYSSHSCSISVQVEISDLSQVEQESSRLYNLLQSSVDAEIQKVGFMPDVAYGIGNNSNGVTNGNGSNGHSNGSNGHRNGSSGHSRLDDRWQCTDGQRGLILRIVNENKLDKDEVESIARQMFQVGVKDCNKMQASQLIEDLLEKVGKKTNGRGSRWRGNQPSRS